MKDEFPDQHVDDLRLPYLEGLLSSEERSNFEDHLRQCPTCTSKLEEMSRWVSSFKENAREMCPEEWELFDYVRSGKDPHGMMSSHLDACPLCRADAESFEAVASKQTVPADLWRKMKGLSGAPVVDRSVGASYQWIWEAVDRLMDLFRPAVLAPVAVAVTILIVVFLYPAGPTARMVALSSVKWGPAPSSWTLMSPDRPTSLPDGAKKERLGAVILFSNVKHLPDQNLTDSFYRAIEPAKQIRDQYDVVSPEELRQVAGEELLKASDEKALVEVMRSKMKISKAVVIEIVPSKEKYGIVAHLIDTATGGIIGKQDSWNLTEAQLAPALESATKSLLEG